MVHYLRFVESYENHGIISISTGYVDTDSMLNRFNSQLPKLFLDGSCCVTGQVLCFCAEQATGSGEPQSGMGESLEIVVLMVS